MKEVMMTTAEVAARLRVPVPTLYKWRLESKGPRSIRIGKHLRYQERDVEAWIAEQIVSSARGGARA